MAIPFSPFTFRGLMAVVCPAALSNHQGNTALQQRAWGHHPMGFGNGK